MGVPIGIDLGTTYSAIAKWENTPGHVGANVYHVPLEGGYTMASKVFMQDENDRTKYIVGQAALNRGALFPDMYFSAFKRGMDQNTVIQRGNFSTTPVELSSIILRELLKVAENVESPKTFVPEGLVVSVPYYFTEVQNQHTVEAVRLALDSLYKGRAGYSDKTFLRLIPEPVAAGLDYVFEHPNDIKDAKVLIFDLGGGTFDVTVFHIINDLDKRTVKFKVLSTGGDARLGGEDFDESLKEYVIASEGIDIDSCSDKDSIKNRILLELDKESTRCKCILSAATEDTMIVAPFFNNSKGLEKVIQQGEFTDCVKGNLGLKVDFCAKIDDVITETIDSSGLRPSDIDRVVLIGGSSRIPCIKKLLSRKFSDNKIFEGNISEGVARGAALLAASVLDKNHNSNNHLARWDNVEIIENTAHSIGVVTHNGRVDQVIGRNVMTPAKGTKLYQPQSLSADGQFVELDKIDIRQGTANVGYVEFPKIWAHGRRPSDITIKVELIAESTSIKALITVRGGDEDGSDLFVEKTLDFYQSSNNVTTLL